VPAKIYAQQMSVPLTFIIDVTVTVPASNVLAACKFGTGIFRSHFVPGAVTSFISYVSPFLLLPPLASFKIWELDYINLS